MARTHEKRHKLSPRVGDLEALVSYPDNRSKTSKRKKKKGNFRVNKHLVLKSAELPPLPHIKEQINQATQSLATVKAMMGEFSTTDIDTIMMSCNHDERKILLDALMGK